MDLPRWYEALIDAVFDAVRPDGEDQLLALAARVEAHDFAWRMRDDAVARGVLDDDFEIDLVERIPGEPPRWLSSRRWDELGIDAAEMRAIIEISKGGEGGEVALAAATGLDDDTLLAMFER